MTCAGLAIEHQKILRSPLDAARNHQSRKLLCSSASTGSCTADSYTPIPVRYNCEDFMSILHAWNGGFRLEYESEPSTVHQ